MAEPTITGHSIRLVYIIFHVSFANKRLNHHHLWHAHGGGYTVARGRAVVVGMFLSSNGFGSVIGAFHVPWFSKDDLQDGACRRVFCR